MSETLVAALIAAAATVSASVLQLKAAVARELATRGQGGRRKSRAPVMLIVILLLAAACGGFALAQWLHEGERIEQDELRRELEARIGEIGRTATQLELTRSGVRAEIEADVLRRLGENGVSALATVGACKPSTITRVAAVAPENPTPTCSEAEATPVTLCAPLPADASVVAVELFARPADATGDWSASRAAPGQEIERARFSDTFTQSDAGDGSRQLCHTFVHWGSDRPRAARMLVRYALP